MAMSRLLKVAAKCQHKNNCFIYSQGSQSSLTDGEGAKSLECQLNTCYLSIIPRKYNNAFPINEEWQDAEHH